MTNITETDVLIIGGGPCGVLLANQLGVYGVKTLVVERSDEIIDYPRAVGIDDESLRSVQLVGQAETLLEGCYEDVPLKMFTRDGRCFAHMEPRTREFGWSRRNIFMQPELEAILRKSLGQYGHVTLETGTSLLEFEQQADGVLAHVEKASGEKRSIKARYMVGADGGRSTVRKQTGIAFEGETHERKWLVIDIKNDPIDEHYTALHGDPIRPWLWVWLPKNYRRLEFMMFEGEDDNEILNEEKIMSLIREKKIHDTDNIEIARARIYTHNSRTAETFKQGDVFLVGDAAHLTEPWIGQGLNAGFRDVTNLSWKLAQCITHGASEELLESYTIERHEHAKAMISLARLFGAIFAMTSTFKAWWRDLFLMSIQGIRPLKRYVTEFRFKPMPRYSHGFVRHTLPMRKDSPVGRMFIQPDVTRPDGSRAKLDACLGNGFAIVGIGQDPAAALSAEQVDKWRKVGTQFVHVAREGEAASNGQTDMVFDMNGALFAFAAKHNHVPIFVIRPDRYVAAFCAPEELAGVLDELGGVLFANT